MYTKPAPVSAPVSGVICKDWSTEQDVLDDLTKPGRTTTFAYLPCHEGVVFDAWDHAYKVRSRTPVFYMVERGPGPESLDAALLNQALDLGVEVRFNSRLKHIRGPGIVATGPKAADAIAVGYHFETAMENGFWVIYDRVHAALVRSAWFTP
ncbi:MAG: hypothetical protein AB1810_08260 [Pseudomonadota bacterium]